MRTGILGGSFNPPHRGHLALARSVLDQGLADQVVLVPAAAPPHKKTPSEADAPTRLEMASLLAGEDDRIFVDDLELRRVGPSYTIDTLRELSAKHPDDSFRLIIGSDMAKIFATWREYRSILELAPPLVAERPDSLFSGDGAETYPGLAPDERAVLERGRFHMDPVDISSTKVRALLEAGAEDAELLDYLTAPVLGFIRRWGLYSVPV